MKKSTLQELDKELKQEGLRDPSVPPPAPDRRQAPNKRTKVARVAPVEIGKIDLEAFAQSIAEKTGIDYGKLGAAIGLAIVQGMKAAAVDPEKEKIKLMRRQQMRETQQEAVDTMVDRWLACSHMRTHPYSGTARIGWATQSDGITRGTCMGCGCLFTPIDSELPDPKRLKGLYEKMRGVPVSIAHNDFLSGMVVAGNPA